MKKKFYLPLLALVGLLGMTSCSSEDGIAQQSQTQKEITTSFTVEVPGTSFETSRAGGDYTNSKLSGYKNCGSKATVYLAMYRVLTAEDGTTSLSDDPVWKGSSPTTDGKASFKISYIQGVPVQIVGYATVGDKKLPDNWDLKKITWKGLSNNNPYRRYLFEANDESEDSFFGNLKGNFGDKNSLTLGRPSCKVRLVLTDWAKAKEVGVEHVNVKVSSDWWWYAKTFNAATGVYNNNPDQTYFGSSTWDEDNTGLPNYSVESSEKTVFVQYFPALNNDQVVDLVPFFKGNGKDVTFTISWKVKNGGSGSKTLTVPSLPIKRNRLVTLRTEGFTDTQEFTVTLDDDLDYGSTTPTPDEQGNYTISEEAELTGLMNKINTDVNNGVNTTITLDGDLNLTKANLPEITLPSGKTSTITIDGQGHTLTGQTKALFTKAYGAQNITVKNIVIDGANITSTLGGGESSAAPFLDWIEPNGAAATYTFENVTVKNCTFSGQYSGGILAHVDGGATVIIKNCKVENCTTGTWHGGAFVGYFAGKQATIDGCTANGNNTPSACLGTLAASNFNITNFTGENNTSGYFDSKKYVNRVATNGLTWTLDGVTKNAAE